MWKIGLHRGRGSPSIAERSDGTPAVMHDTPFPPGEPVRQRGGETKYFEPVIAATEAAEPAAFVGFEPPSLFESRRPAVSWREMRCVGFADIPDAADQPDESIGWEADEPPSLADAAPAIHARAPVAMPPAIPPPPAVRERTVRRRQ